ncbi:hypothetical protein QYM36_010757 [Artemia franciscana]|uniref:Uncharacterized protein n=1 Tax=Artemia franciscana TaxID=6661 RepID=A0AA88L7X4_ARTSF|nr:hypothetical protein QYM36_010757 [Artemia franciscana]
MLRNMDWMLHFTLFFLSKSLVQGGRLAVLNSPSSVSLRQISSLKFHDVVKLYGSILGFSKDGQDGSKLIDIKSYPEMVITVTVDGFIDFNDSLVQYKLIEDSRIEGLPEMIRTQAADIYGDDEFRLREIDLASSGLEDKDVPQSPSAPIDERLSLALIGKELNALKTEASEILKRKEENNGRINAFWYSLEGLKSVDSEFGKTSREAEEVRRSITNSIRYLQRALDKAYGDKVIIILLFCNINT